MSDCRFEVLFQSVISHALNWRRLHETKGIVIRVGVMEVNPSSSSKHRQPALDMAVSGQVIVFRYCNFLGLCSFTLIAAMNLVLL